MRSFITLFVVLFLCADCFSQDKERNIVVKLYNLSSYEEPLQGKNPLPDIYRFDVHDDAQHLHPTLAVLWAGKGRWTHEIEVSNFSASKRTSSIDQVVPPAVSFNYLDLVETHLAIRYESILSLRPSTAKVIPSIGFATSPYFKKMRTNALASNVFPSRKTDVGLRVFIVPRINWNITPRVFLDLNVPFCLADLDFQTVYVKNPQIPARQQRQSEFFGKEFPIFYSGRIGVGVRI